MVYSRPRPDAVDAARARVKTTVGAYRRAAQSLPEPVQDAIGAYVGALGAEAAAQRIRAKRLEAQLDALRAERRGR